MLKICRDIKIESSYSMIGQFDNYMTIEWFRLPKRTKLTLVSKEYGNEFVMMIIQITVKNKNVKLGLV